MQEIVINFLARQNMTLEAVGGEIFLMSVTSQRVAHSNETLCKIEISWEIFNEKQRNKLSYMQYLWFYYGLRSNITN